MTLFCAFGDSEQRRDICKKAGAKGPGKEEIMKTNHSLQKAGRILAVLALTACILTVGVFAAEEAAAEYVSPFFCSFWALVPPIIAIVLALITKEVYSSLFIGILAGGLLYSNFSFTGTIQHVFIDGMVNTALADAYNVGILLFLVLMGAMVCLMNKAGGSAAFGRWAETHIKSRVGAQLATVALGVLIFIDDYFNCLTVGSVMRPVTDGHRVSRAKLAFLGGCRYRLCGRGERPGSVCPGYPLQLLRLSHLHHAGDPLPGQL